MSGPAEDDLRRFAEGRHERLWEVLGALPSDEGGEPGTTFAVWAPSARSVSVVGEWNGWDGAADPLVRHGDVGVWSGFVTGVGTGALYKLDVTGVDGTVTRRADPMARMGEHSGGMASIVFESRHEWSDGGWMDSRPTGDPVRERLSTYEVHLGSWRRHADGSRLTYRELAPLLADHALELGFSHVELLPVAEHPYDPSWGYQVTGYYAPTSRFGDPDDFRWFVDHLHHRGIGVIVDWVSAHFPRDEWALAQFDGGPLYEHTDPWRAEHPDWGTLEFDYTRPEVRSFLISNALYWLGELHVDGLRVDAVASMLYLDYSRGPGEWTPNAQGGNEDIDAVAFLQELNTTVARVQPGALCIAEESTAWDGVSRPAHEGGLGFTHKWNMGWMHDTLGYWAVAPADRRWHHDQLTFGLTYAWAEHFVLPFSHDEVVHEKRPLLGKMAGDTDEERFANLRALYTWMWAHPGRPLVFMGAELADDREWSPDRGLAWDLLADPRRAGVSALIAELNRLHAAHPALHAEEEAAFEWLLVDDAEHSTFAFERRAPGEEDVVVCVANLSGVAHEEHRVGLRVPGPWTVALATDEARFGGAAGARSPVVPEPTPWQGRDHSAVVPLPPLTVLYLVPEGNVT